MNNSLEFVRNRIETGNCNNMDIKNFSNMSICDFWLFISTVPNPKFQSLFVNNITTYKMEGEVNGVKGNRNVIIEYNPNAKFEYFTMEACKCDGTLLFLNEIMYEAFKKVLMCTTYNTNTVPADLMDRYWDYDTCYTVGDFVVNTEYGEFGTTEKPWMNTKWTAMLPIKCEWKLAAQNMNFVEGIL
jgi:hypothetical protein